MKCVCPYLKVGHTVTDQRNWNPDCPEHGVDSAWWNSDEQIAKRKAQSKRLRELQRQARERRET